MNGTRLKLSSCIACAAAVALAAGAAAATPLLGCDMGPESGEGAMIYDVDPATGLATNPRNTGIPSLIEIALSPEGRLYGVSSFVGENHDDWEALFEIDPATGESTRIGRTGFVGVFEGGLSFQPGTGVLYGLSAQVMFGGADGLFTVDLATGAGTVIGNVDIDEYNSSGMAFDRSGRLYMLDTYKHRVLTLDPSNAAILESAPLSRQLGAAAGMDVDPATGILYVADGSRDGTDTLYTLDPMSGVLTEIGHTGLEEGMSGLAFIPEPIALLVLPLALLLRRRRRVAT